VKPDRYANLKCGQVGGDEAVGEVVLVTNCICCLPHRDTEEYEESHADGCLMVPYEGMVVQMAGEKVVTWRLCGIRDRQLTLLPDALVESIQQQMVELLKQDRYRVAARKRKATMARRYGGTA
jgi:hypothetical protein